MEDKKTLVCKYLVHANYSGVNQKVVEAGDVWVGYPLSNILSGWCHS